MRLPVKPMLKPQRRPLITYEANELSGWLRSSDSKRETERGVWTAGHALVKSVELQPKQQSYWRLPHLDPLWSLDTQRLQTLAYLHVLRLQRPALKFRQIGWPLDTVRTPLKACWLLRCGRKGHWPPPGWTRRQDSHVGLDRLVTDICHRLMSMTSKRLPG